jgi:hypothetical protein
MGIREGVGRLPFVDFRRPQEAKQQEAPVGGVGEVDAAADEIEVIDISQEATAVDPRQATKDLARESREARFSPKAYSTPGVEKLTAIPPLGPKQIAAIGRNNPEEGAQIAAEIRAKRAQNLDMRGVSRRNNFE